MKKITQLDTNKDYFLDEEGVIYNSNLKKIKGTSIRTKTGFKTFTRDKWIAIVYQGAPIDKNFYTKRINNKIKWSLFADKSYLQTNSYVPEYDDFRTTFFYYLCDSRDGIPRYVGKTIDPKVRIVSHINNKNKGLSYKNNWINGVMSDGGKVEMIIIDELNPDGTEGSGDWRWLEEYWGNQLLQWGFPVIKDANWGYGGMIRKLTQEEKDNQIKLQTNISGKKVYVYELYTNKVHTFQSGNECSRFFNDKKCRKGRVDLGHLTFVGSDYLVSHKELTLDEKIKTIKESQRVKLKVVKLTLDGEYLKTYNSIKDAIRDYGPVVFSVLSDKTPKSKTGYGFKWVYLYKYLYDI
jgi:hypothetical protein